VVDAATGRDLDDVTVLRAAKWPREDLTHPGGSGEGRVIVRSAASPVTLPASAERPSCRTLLVGAPQHAWARVELHREPGGERLVRLEPGASLEVVIAGSDPAVRVVLRVSRAGAESRKPLAELDPPARGATRLDGLPAGRLRVALEIGDWWREPRVLAEAEVELRPGETTPLTLRPEAVEVPALAPLSGLVVIPEAWEIDQPFLSVHLRDPLLAGGRETVYPRLVETDDPEIWRFDAGDVQPGRYRAEVHECPWEVVFVVPPGGLSGLRIEVPPPGRVVVTVLDAATGEPADLPDIDWHPRRPEPDMGGGVGSAERDPGTGRYVFRAPQGEVVLGVVTDGWRVVQKTVTVGPGTTEATLRVSRTGGSIRLTVREGEAAVPWRFEWKVRIEAVGGPGRVVGGSYDSEAHVAELSHEGLYRVRFPTLPGFEPVPPVEVRVRSGEVTPLEIRLVRAR
jgi:hypothetical protein